MPASFLARHRTICAVLYEIKERARALGDDTIPPLADEAILYAHRMSLKLMEYKTTGAVIATEPVSEDNPAPVAKEIKE